MIKGWRKYNESAEYEVTEEMIINVLLFYSGLVGDNDKLREIQRIFNQKIDEVCEMSYVNKSEIPYSTTEEYREYLKIVDKIYKTSKKNWKCANIIFDLYNKIREIIDVDFVIYDDVMIELIDDGFVVFYDIRPGINLGIDINKRSITSNEYIEAVSRVNNTIIKRISLLTGKEHIIYSMEFYSDGESSIKIRTDL